MTAFRTFFTTAALVILAKAQAPARAPTYVLNQSTIIMPWFVVFFHCSVKKKNVTSILQHHLYNKNKMTQQQQRFHLTRVYKGLECCGF